MYISLVLEMIGLVTSNMAEAIRFYRHLGLEFPEPDGPYVETTTAGGMRVSLNDTEMIKGIDPAWREPSGGQRISLAFQCGTPAGVDAQYQELVDAGFSGYKEPWDAFWGMRYAIVSDPDGNHVELAASLPPG
jgi:uncharacterized glyoxalase superfamily protein PhnB